MTCFYFYFYIRKYNKCLTVLNSPTDCITAFGTEGSFVEIWLMLKMYFAIAVAVC